MNIKPIDAGKLTQDNMMGYSAAVLLNRAIPDIRDGLKPSYRHILYSMYRNKVFTYTKSRSIDGEVAKMHPHGSSYETMVGMAQRDRHFLPLIDGDGWWGLYTSSELTAAADRYTNAKMSEWSKFLFRDIHKGIVPFISNYDGTIDIPEILPVPFPLILVMAQSGIGVGFSSKTASHNINEIADAIITYLNTGEVPNLIPDFPTGATLLRNNNTISSINNEGSGSVRLRAKAEIDGLNIIISEIPYGVTVEQVIDKIVKEAKTDKLSEVSNVQDLSGKDKFEINIRAKRGSDMEVLLEKLYKFTPLESTYPINAMVLVDGLPRQLGTKDIVKTWTEWRLECIGIDIANQVDSLNKDIEILEGYSIVKDNMDKFIKLMRFADDLTKTLEEELKFTNNQAKHVSNMQLRNINEKYLQKKIDLLEETIDKRDKLLKLTNKDHKKILIDDMKYVKKHFGHPRKTQIVDEDKIKDNIKELQKEIKADLIDDSDYWITVSKKGFLYKTIKKTDSITLPPQDSIKYQIKLNNLDDEVFVYTKDRNGVKTQIREIEVSKPNIFGQRLDVDEDNIVDFGFVTDKFKYIILILESGRIVKFDNESYRPGTNVFKPTHTDRYEISHVLFLEEDVELKVSYKDKSTANIHTKDIRVTKSRTGTGQFIKQNNRKNVVKVEIVR